MPILRPTNDGDLGKLGRSGYKKSKEPQEIFDNPTYLETFQRGIEHFSIV